MNPQTIQQLMLVRAVEEADLSGEEIPLSEREDATRQALTEIGDPGQPATSKIISRKQWQFFARRAEILHERTHHPVHSILPSLGTSKIAGGICLAAFVIGCASHMLGLTRSFDIVALPILFLLVWNLVVYALLLYKLLRPSPPSEKEGLLGFWITRLLLGRQEKNKESKASQVYLKALASWLKFWLSPAMLSWFHAGSACLVLGLLAAVYLRGLNREYVAVWESTWLSASGVQSFIGGLLSPASWISGIPLPATAEEWNQWRSSSGTGGAHAGRWIHLYAVTMIGGIVLPRILLAAQSSWISQRRRTAPPPWRSNERYVAQLLNQSQSSSESHIAVLPFDSKNTQLLRDAQFQKSITRLIHETWGLSAIPCWLETVRYGDEEDAFAKQWCDALTCDGAVLILDIKATPEDEVHGALLAAVAKHFAASEKGLLVVLESSGINQSNMTTRLDIWKKLVRAHHMTLLPVKEGMIIDACISPTSCVFQSH